MEALNKVELRGKVGEIRITQVGNAKVANFSVCTNFSYTGKDGTKVIETCWHKVAVWANTDKQAEYIARIKPETPVFVSGRIKVRSYVRADGAQTTIHEIVAQRVEILKEEITPETEHRNS